MALFINGVGQDTFNMNGVSIDNLYVDGVLVWSSVVPEATIPRYELTEALVDASTIDDSANTLPDYNGLLTESDGTTPYEPTELQYPQNGLLELDNGRIMDTQFEIDTSLDMYGLYGIYDADGTTTYKIWALDMIGANLGTLYEGDQDTPLTETGGIYIADMAGVYKVTDGRPSWMPSLDPVYGPELIQGGGNDNGATNESFWTSISGNSQNPASHNINLVNYLIGYTNVANLGMYQAFTTEVDATYEVNIDVVGGSDFAVDPDGTINTWLSLTDAIPTGGNEGTESTPTSSTTPSSETFDFVASGTTSYISLKCDVNWRGGNASKISVKKRT